MKKKSKAEEGKNENAIKFPIEIKAKNYTNNPFGNNNKKDYKTPKKNKGR